MATTQETLNSIIAGAVRLTKYNVADGSEEHETLQKLDLELWDLIELLEDAAELLERIIEVGSEEG